MAHEIKFARITCSGKLADRFLSCQHTASPDLSRSSMGEVFSIVEILSPWFPTAQIGQLIINNFAKSYYKGGSTSDLLNFEESLKYVNESLAQATQNGETDWIGKLNSILAVIIDNNLHIAPTGKIEAYILRDGKVNHLTEGLSGSVEVHPLKTFSNVISGELKPHDKVLLTSGNLIEHLSLESVRQIITLNNPSMAASQIAKLLRKSRVKNVNLIIVSLYSKEELSAEPVDQTAETVFYLDKSSDNIAGKLKYLWTNILTPLSKITGSFLKRAAKKTAEKASQKIKNIRKEKELTPPADLPPAKPQENIPEGDRFHREFLKETPRDDGLLKDEEISYSPDYVHYYKEKKAPKERNFGKYFQNALRGLSSLFGFILTTARDKKRRKYLFIISAIILIGIIALFATSHGKKTKVGNIEAQNLLDQAIATQKDAENLLQKGNQEGAKEKFGEAIDKARTILNNTFVAKDANAVLTASYQEMDKMTATTRYSDLTALSTSPDKTNSCYVSSGNVFFIGNTIIYRGNVLGGAPQKVATLPAGKGSIISTTQSNKIIYLYTNDQNVFSYDSITNRLEQVNLPSGKWETANSTAYYVGSLYLLDGVLGQIYRHQSTESTFDTGDGYLSSNKTAIKQGVSMAIDGSIYVLTNNGTVTEIQRSKVQDFSLSGLPTPYDKITEPVKIFTDTDTPSLYILDRSQKRVVEFDKDGHFIHQYALPDNFDEIKDFIVSTKSRKIWVLQKNSLYELNI